MAHIERLQQLVRVLETVRDDKRPFDMQSWAAANDAPLISAPVNECGTASCAAGWAARDPWFRRRGFTMENYISFFGREKPHVVYRRGDNHPTHQEACQVFFEITHEEADDLFGEHNNNQIRSAIARVKRVIKRHAKAAP